MKKINFYYAATCIFSALIMHGVPCQVLVNAAVPNIIAAEVVMPGDNDAVPVNSRDYYRNDINIKAVRAFIKNFKEAKKVTWYKSREGGCSATFENDSIQTTVVYDHRGSCNYIINRYNENRMPAYLRGMVKKAFGKYTIIEVTEFKTSLTDENISYGILIKYAENCKVLKIFKEEMKIINDYTKL